MIFKLLKKLQCRTFASGVCQKKSPKVCIKKIVDPLCLSEGPFWDQRNKLLLFVDIVGHSVHKYDPASCIHQKLILNDSVGFIIPVKDENCEYIVSQGAELHRLHWCGSNYELTHLTEACSPKVEEVKNDKIDTTSCNPKDRIAKTDSNTKEKEVKVRVNDAKADHHGNIWLGTMALEDAAGRVEMKKGSLYRYSTEGELDTFADEISISNGITWNIERNKMFYIDSPTFRVDVFDYNEKEACVQNRRPFFDFKAKGIPGCPDGMTTDCEDNLWIASYGGSMVVKVSGRSGIVLGTLKLPVEQITSVAFGGVEMNTLFITTSKFNLGPTELEKQPLAGAVFAVDGLGVYGVKSLEAVLPPKNIDKKKSGCCKN